jgi:hypothetical protein
MKTTLIACVLAFTIIGTSKSSAANPNGAAIALDTVVIRPVCFAATIVGSAFFVLSLPFAAASRSVHQTAETLVLKPAAATFTRPLGEMDLLLDYH